MSSELLLSLPYAAAVVGRDYRIVATNRACNELFGGEDGLVGRPCHEAFHAHGEPCDHRGEKCPVRHYRESGEPGRVVHLHLTPRGEEHHEVVVYPIDADESPATSFVEILRPIAIASARPSRTRLVGRSPAFLEILELTLRVAPRDTPVLLLGEIGTGREQLARAIHQLSRRSAEPFIAVSCSGLSGTLFEPEMIGAALRSSPGLAEQPGQMAAADRGTLYLDDLGNLPLASQRQLLRLLKRGIPRSPDGSPAPALDFRLISAAEPDLSQKLERAEFLPELYYRIGTFPLVLPPLRQRLEDLPLLAASLLRQIGCCPHPELHPETLIALRRYAFPGNLPELRRILERACVRSGTQVILPEHLPEELLSDWQPARQ